MDMETLEGQMPSLQEKLMIEKLMVISAYALPALILLIISSIQFFALVF